MVYMIWLVQGVMQVASSQKQLTHLTGFRYIFAVELNFYVSQASVQCD